MTEIKKKFIGEKIKYERWLDKLERERVEDCNNYDLNYGYLCDSLGIKDIERPELYEQAKAEELYIKAKRQGKKLRE